MTAPITPGEYLRRRREASGMTLDDVAAKISTEPRIDERGRRDLIAGIEGGAIALTMAEAAALHAVFRFDPQVLVRLVPPVTGDAPRLCRICACSERDACFDIDAGACFWIAPDLCSVCGPIAVVAVQPARSAA